MVVIGGNIWCGTANTIKILNPATKEVEDVVTVGQEESKVSTRYLDIIYTTIHNMYTGDLGHGGVRGRGGGVGGAAGLSLSQAPARDHLHHPDRGTDRWRPADRYPHIHYPGVLHRGRGQDADLL